jgi:glyoxylase-like metal-dependent hydrolase (beta-lactamase superfamily II)/rhodanese-related sulfurtransferase
MFFRELNRGKCKTYMIGCEATREAALVDPVKERVDRYLAVLAYWDYRLELAIDTHTHADHRSGVWDLREIAGARVIMHRRAPAPHVDLHVDDGDELMVGEVRVKIVYTPGHTPDGISLVLADRVLTGDTLLIHGTGRADFGGGDAGAQYDSITQKLFHLPDTTLVFPAHDYRGHTQSTIGEERRNNPRIAGRSRSDYTELMGKLNLGLPDKIQESLQANQSAIEDDSIEFPSLAQLDLVRQLGAEDLRAKLAGSAAPLLLDVREPDEFDGELGHIPGSRLLPLKEVSAGAAALAASKDQEIVVVCRAGVRSATAAAILTALGFERVSNLKGGMLEWNERGFPVER